MEPFAPRSLGRQSEVSLTGKLIPWDPALGPGQPILLAMPMSEARYLPCFSNEDDLRKMMRALEITGYTIKHVDDGADFMSGLPAVYGHKPLHVMLDPYMTAEGTIRFKQVVGAS